MGSLAEQMAILQQEFRGASRTQQVAEEERGEEYTDADSTARKRKLVPVPVQYQSIHIHTKPPPERRRVGNSIYIFSRLPRALKEEGGGLF